MVRYAFAGSSIKMTLWALHRTQVGLVAVAPRTLNGIESFFRLSKWRIGTC